MNSFVIHRMQFAGLDRMISLMTSADRCLSLWLDTGKRS